MPLPRRYRLLSYAPFLCIGVAFAILAHVILWVARFFSELALVGMRGKNDPEMDDIIANDERFEFWVKWIVWSRQHFWH